MRPDDHETAMMAVISAMTILQQVDLAKAIENAGRAESVGPILDPTLYREKSGALAEDKELMQAAMLLWRKAEGHPEVTL